MAAIDNIKVRMYRQGFGDCFLLQFMEGDNRISSMVIDCGLKTGDSVETAPLGKVVRDIADTITPEGQEKPELDFMVVTHEHWDHVSGFAPNRKLFDDFSIHQTWMAWTEDPDDDVAIQVNKRLENANIALHIVNEKIKSNLTDKQAFYSQFYSDRGGSYLNVREKFSSSLDELIGLSAPFTAKEKIVTDSGIEIEKYEISMGTEKAMNHIKGIGAQTGSVKFYSPGKVIQDRKRLPGLRVYVLGPPKTASLNKDAALNKGADKETYYTMKDASLDGFVGGVLAAQGIAGSNYENGNPFAGSVHLPKDLPETKALYNTSYFNETKAWRTIEDDWLDIGGALALQMDEDTNNTSLVLAIEFVASGRVLLFPGDAQVGSWESWHNVEFKVKKDDETEVVTAADLLSRTVLYKVSHHCSHNATLRQQGLELMESEELVALVPEKNDRYSGIPHRQLVERLKQLTRGRMIFSADKNFPLDNFKDQKPRRLSSDEWDGFTKRLEIGDLFIEYTVVDNN